MIFMIRESCLKFCIRASILNFLSCGARSALYPLAEVRGFTASTVKFRKALSRHFDFGLISKKIFHNFRRASSGVFAGEHNEKNRLWFLCADGRNVAS